MFKFTRTRIFCFAMIIIFCVIQIFIKRYSIQTEIDKEVMEKQQVEEMPEVKIVADFKIWQIEIPKISLIANIVEGTSKEVLSKYVGHFETTSKKQGNIGLASCNRGYEINNFKNLKLLKEGDEIIYKYNEYEKRYVVEKCRIIKNTELDYLDQTEDNMLTLITYVENQPKYRRCVQAVECNNDENIDNSL